MARLLVVGILLAVAPRQEKSHKIPPVDLKQPVIWGSVCELPDGSGLAFGGQDQRSDDGNPHTRIRENGEWKAIHEELRAKNPAQKAFDGNRRTVGALKGLAARARALHFRGLPAAEELERLKAETTPEAEKASAGPEAFRIARAELESLGLRKEASAAEFYRALARSFTKLEKEHEPYDFEPPPRALSPLAYDSKSKLYVLFAGDHLDYLTNDTWVFDPAARKWSMRSPAAAPPPRANHSLEAVDGKVILKGGYTYTSATGYVSGQYRERGDGEWTYDLEKNEWSGAGNMVPPDSRVYRTGPYDPDFFMGDKPDAKAGAAKLDALPENEWVAMNPPKLPRLNRDWGTAILDPDRDLILRWSGGHSAHGGTDVLHYHLSTNRWELPFPVEFPLGQLYSNTSYPEGVNFNGRPWVTGHTYQNYGYDPAAKRMVYAGRDTHTYFYDPDRADWAGRVLKPKGMVYNDCFYTLTLTSTPSGLHCWTQHGKLFRHESAKGGWAELALTGAKLPGAVVDNSTVVHDRKRDRLLFWRKGYGDKNVYDGEIHAVDLKTLAVSALGPAGREGAAEVPYLCQIRYDAANDLLLVGGTLTPGEDGFRRTPAYDPEKNRWVSLKITGQDPSGKKGRNVSLGMMYDAKRKLFWAVDTDSRVFVLRLVPGTADLRPLR